jgi:cell division protease FtsH
MRACRFTYIPAKTEDRALLFETEIRAQLAMLMGGRAAEEVTCGGVSTGAVDDIRRATDLALRAVSEYGLSALVGPVSMATLVGGGSEDLPVLRTDSGTRLITCERPLCNGPRPVTSTGRTWVE